MRKPVLTLLACAASAGVITWLGTYVISPMDPLLGAPAWAFSRLFAEFIEMQPSVIHYVTLEQIIIFSRIANFAAWFAAFRLLAVIARRIVVTKRVVV